MWTPWSMLSYLKLGIGFLVGASIVGGAAYWLGRSQGDSQGYARYAAEQSVKDLGIEKSRKRYDEHVQNLDDYTFCVESLHARGLPVDACEQLRGIPEE